MQCETLAEHLAAAGGSELEDEASRLHVETCLRCQAEVAQYRKLLKALRTLRTEVLTPAPGLVADVLLHLEEAGERAAMRSAVRGRKLAYGAAIGVAATAGAAGAALVFARRRTRRAA